MSTDILEGSRTDVDGLLSERTIPYEEPNQENFTHIVNPPGNLHIWKPGMSAQEIVNIARVTRQPVRALCGKVWIPTRNPEQHPACDTCIETAGKLMRGAGGGRTYPKTFNVESQVGSIFQGKRPKRWVLLP